MNAWHTEVPDLGTIAWVWYNTLELLAFWTGKQWMTLDSREVLRGVTHWRLE